MAWYPIAPATASSVATLPAMVAAVICVMRSAISITPQERPYHCASPPAASPGQPEYAARRRPSAQNDRATTEPNSSHPPPVIVVRRFCHQGDLLDRRSADGASVISSPIGSSSLLQFQCGQVGNRHPPMTIVFTVSPLSAARHAGTPPQAPPVDLAPSSPQSCPCRES